MPIKRTILVVACGLAVGLLAGCQPEEIRSYQVKKPEQDRMLGAIVSHKSRTWFFKLVGPADQVEAQKAAFDEFLRSVQFPEQGDKPVDWKVPEGWRRVQSKQSSRYATFEMGPEDKPLELTVTYLRGRGGSELANVNRWRGQLGLYPLAEEELDGLTIAMKVGDQRGRMVDITGQRVAAGSMPEMPGAGQPQIPFDYTIPEGWTEVPSTDGFSLVTIQVTDRTQTATVTVSQAGGALLENVNRWREKQLGLPRIGSEEELRTELQEIKLASGPAHYVDLTGREQGGKRERILAVIVPGERFNWFFKMRGPADVVAKQKAAFEMFVKSVKFAAGTGAKDG